MDKTLVKRGIWGFTDGAKVDARFPELCSIRREIEAAN